MALCAGWGLVSEIAIQSALPWATVVVGTWYVSTTWPSELVVQATRLPLLGSTPTPPHWAAGTVVESPGTLSATPAASWHWQRYAVTPGSATPLLVTRSVNARLPPAGIDPAGAIGGAGNAKLMPVELAAAGAVPSAGSTTAAARTAMARTRPIVTLMPETPLISRRTARSASIS